MHRRHRMLVPLGVSRRAPSALWEGCDRVEDRNIGPSPAFASSIALRTSPTSSPLSRASATSVVLFLEPGRLPPLPFSKGRPRTPECGCGLGDRSPVSGFSISFAHLRLHLDMALWKYVGYYRQFCNIAPGRQSPRAKSAYLRGLSCCERRRLQIVMPTAALLHALPNQIVFCRLVHPVRLAKNVSGSHNHGHACRLTLPG